MGHFSKTAAIAFFEDFVACFSRFDGNAIAAKCITPFFSVDAQGFTRVYKTHTHLQNYFQGHLDAYYAKGCRSCSYHSLQLLRMSSKEVLATVSWQLHGARGDTLMAWQEAYLLSVTRGPILALASFDVALC
ncbi:MAG: hypothetical protein R3183_05290 [Oleiphilaceae bacterium]|nr:hypothetical protein [Oleiphilaceae bacterium]